jgi:putative redox protein
MTEKKAVIHYSGDDLFIGVSPSGHAHTIDTSDNHIAPSPMEMLMTALGACTGVDVVSILRKKREQVTGYRIEVTGERADDYPRRWTKLHVKHFLKGVNLSEAAVKQAIELSEEKYCSVAGTLRPTAEITSSYVIEHDTQAAGTSA